MIRIKRAVSAAVVLAGFALAGCSSSDKLLGSDGSTVVNGGAAGVGTPSTERALWGSTGVLQVGSANGCLKSAFAPNASDHPDCHLAVVRHIPSCDCTGPGLSPSGFDAYAMNVFEEAGLCGNAGQPACSEYCACNVEPATGPALTQCRQAANPTLDGSGWCYVSTAEGDDPAALPSECTADHSQTLRVVGEAAPEAGDLIRYECSNVLPPPVIPPQAAAAIGEPCIGSDEWSPYFSGYSAQEVNLEDRATQCESNICLINHLQGRASCPYGQAKDSGDCLLPGGSAAVSSKVEPQLEARQANVASICSCRCDGDGPGPYCACPESMQCEHLIDDLGLGGPDLAGSYCIPKGSKYDAAQRSGPVCTAPNCGPSHPN